MPQKTNKRIKNCIVCEKDIPNKRMARSVTCGSKCSRIHMRVYRRLVHIARSGIKNNKLQKCPNCKEYALSEEVKK